jgi:glycosyltransferase 2 family protein
VSALRRRGLELLCLALGTIILASTLWVIGVESLLRDLRLIGWGLAVILLVESLSVLVNTGGWALAFPRGERRVSAGRLLASRLAGDGVNYLTPSATVGGELLRVRLLGHQMASSLRWASVSAAKIGQSVAQAIFILLGLALIVPRLAIGSSWLGELDATIAVGALVTAIVLGVVFLWAVARGFWATFRGALSGIGLAGLLPPSWAGPGRDVDLALRRLGSWRAAASLGCFVLGWAVGAAEIYLILAWLGGPVDWQSALALETGSVLLDGLLFFVPAKVGTQEGGKVVLFAALGLHPARGLTVGVVRRIRELVYAGIGLLALGWLSAGSSGGARRSLPGLLADGSPRRA